MKKIAVLLCALLIAVPLVGCSGNNVVQPSFSKSIPWDSSINFKSETTKYKVTKYYMESQDNRLPVTNDSSSLEFVVSSNGNEAYYTLETKLTISYTDSEYLSDEFKGKTDTITSKAEFRKDTFEAVSSEKNVVLQSQPDKNYSFSADYTAGIAKGSIGGKALPDISFKNEKYVDNEYIFFFVRALSGMGGTLNQSFNVVNWYDCFLKGKFSVASVTASAYSAAVEGVKIGNPELLSGVEDGDGKDTSNGLLVCYPIQLMLNGSKSGAPLYAYYSTSPYSTKLGNISRTSSSLIAELATFEYTTAGKIVYRTEYIMDDFTVSYF